jgi:hypothetical protein
VDDILKTISIIAFLTLVGHFLFLMLHNTFRIKRLIKFVDRFKNEGKLSDSDYRLLYDRYTSVFHYLEFYPDKEDFKTLYENLEFDQYVRKSKRKLKYCSFVIGISFLVLLMVIPFNERLK